MGSQGCHSKDCKWASGPRNLFSQSPGGQSRKLGCPQGHSLEALGRSFLPLAAPGGSQLPRPVATSSQSLPCPHMASPPRDCVQLSIWISPPQIQNDSISVLNHDIGKDPTSKRGPVLRLCVHVDLEGTLFYAQWAATPLERLPCTGVTLNDTPYIPDSCYNLPTAPKGQPGIECPSP